MQPVSLIARTRLAGLLLVAVYLCTLPAALPLAFAAVARVEGSHGVEMAVAGSVSRVTLTHGAECMRLPHAAIHQHCLLAKALASFSTLQNGSGPDHVVRFESGLRILDERRILPPPQPFDASECAPQFVVIAEIALPPTVAVFSPLHCFPVEHAPPDFLLGLKSTLLLI